MSEDPSRILIERDALKGECIRMMDEIASLKRQLAQAHGPPSPIKCALPECGKPLDCGGACYLEPGHHGPCMCSGDMDGPGSCPA